MATEPNSNSNPTWHGNIKQMFTPCEINCMRIAPQRDLVGSKILEQDIGNPTLEIHYLLKTE